MNSSLIINFKFTSNYPLLTDTYSNWHEVKTLGAINIMTSQFTVIIYTKRKLYTYTNCLVYAWKSYCNRELHYDINKSDLNVCSLNPIKTISTALLSRPQLLNVQIWNVDTASLLFNDLKNCSTYRKTYWTWHLFRFSLQLLFETFFSTKNI
jgi:hypothetical protein